MTKTLIIIIVNMTKTLIIIKVNMTKTLTIIIIVNMNHLFPHSFK